LDDRGVAPPADIVCCLDILRCLNASTREFAELSQRPNRCQLQAIGFIWRAREAALVFGGVTMHMSNESLLVILFVGLVVGRTNRAGGRFRTHRRSRNRHYWRIHWRLVATSSRYPSWYRNCFPRSSTPPLAPCCFCLWLGFCEAALEAAGAEAGADADGGSNHQRSGPIPPKLDPVSALYGSAFFDAVIERDFNPVL
jgi:hypothetical protein